jgi:hypothetical protein
MKSLVSGKEKCVHQRDLRRNQPGDLSRQINCANEVTLLIEKFGDHTVARQHFPGWDFVAGLAILRLRSGWTADS